LLRLAVVSRVGRSRLLRRRQRSAYLRSFTERGLSNVPLEAGTNVRVFNDVSLDAQDYITYDKVTGISLQIYNPSIKLPDGTISNSHAFAPLVIERL
jgi:hypothetical protein